MRIAFPVRFCRVPAGLDGVHRLAAVDRFGQRLVHQLCPSELRSDNALCRVRWPRARSAVRMTEAASTFCIGASSIAAASASSCAEWRRTSMAAVRMAPSGVGFAGAGDVRGRSRGRARRG